MLVVFLHGWSVTNTATYGGLPGAIAKNAPPKLAITLGHLHLGRYVSFSDDVTVEDIARGMQHAIVREILPRLSKGERFACITHSTGGPVARRWIDLFYKDRLNECPLQHLVMLAPPNHGSALAQLGKGRLSRMKFFDAGVQPGTSVLEWLELGSDAAWQLNASWLGYNGVGAGLYPFVLTGQTIDRRFYDNLNSYTGEAGSDGVVRVSSANLNYGLLRLVQEGDVLSLQKIGRARRTAFGILPDLSHSGTDLGIMESVSPQDDGSHPTVRWVLKCLSVRSTNSYSELVKGLEELSDATQDAERRQRTRQGFAVHRTFLTSRYCMLLFRVVDDRGTPLTDYDVIFTAGPAYDENHLPAGFFRDRQRNSRDPGQITYFVDYDVLATGLATDALQGKFGLRTCARPDTGFAHYRSAEYRGTFSAFAGYIEPNQTVMIEIQLERHIGEGVFRLTQDLSAQEFRDQSFGEDI